MSEDYEDDDIDDGWCVDCGDDHGDVLDDDEWVCRECLLVRYNKLAEENQRLAAEVELQDKEIVHLHGILTPEQIESELKRDVDIQSVSRRVKRCLERSLQEKEAARG